MLYFILSDSLALNEFGFGFSHWLPPTQLFPQSHSSVWRCRGKVEEGLGSSVYTLGQATYPPGALIFAILRFLSKVPSSSVDL